MSERKYIGARYVPLFADPLQWDSTRAYEPLTIVLHNGNSYTSRQYVPIGIDIANDTYWALSADYNAAIQNIDNIIPTSEFSSANTVKDYIDGGLSTVDAEIDALAAKLPDTDFTSTNTVKNYIDSGLSVEALASVRAFDTVADMQAAADLENGMVCHTNGFHASGDGGAAYYKVSDTGTANGMDVLALQGSLFATLVITEPYVTPEMFGAYGDDTHDDSPIFEYVLQNINDIAINLTSGKTYKLESLVYINSYGISINGNKATIKGYGYGIFYLNSTCQNINLDNIVFNLPTTETPEPNFQSYCIGASHSDADDYRGDGVNNINIVNCSFDGGMSNINLSNATNVKIDKCVFGDAWVNNQYTSGGYNVLLQSCYDCCIENNEFTGIAHGRHNVYVSVDQSKTSNKQNENITIKNNYFDNSNQLRISDNSSFIVVRSSTNVNVENNLFSNGVGISATSDDGLIKGLNVSFNAFEDIEYLPNMPNENKYPINLIGNNTYGIYGSITGNHENESNDYSGFVSAMYFTGQIINNTTLGLKNILINTGCNIFVDNFYSRRQTGLVHFDASMNRGFINSLRTLNSNGWVGAAVTFANGITVPLSIITDDLLQYSLSAGGSFSKISRRMLECTFTSNGSHSYTFSFPWCSETKMLLDAVFENGLYSYKRTANAQGSITIDGIYIPNQGNATNHFVFKPIRGNAVTSDD